MDMFLQVGHGMMDHCRHFIGRWGKGCVILSPRDLEGAQLQSLAEDIIKAGGSVCVDPQFYLPHADHKRLVSHEYWPSGYESADFWSSPALTDFLSALRELKRT